jgi:hypothetical protein
MCTHWCNTTTQWSASCVMQLQPFFLTELCTLTFTSVFVQLKHASGYIVYCVPCHRIHCMLQPHQIPLDHILLVDGRLGSRLRGYHPVAPRPFKVWALCAPPLVLPIISRGTPCQATWETSVSEGRNWVRNGWSIWPANSTSCKSQSSFTCCKSATWDRWLYFPSEGRHGVDFFAWKIRWLRPGSNLRS